MIEGNTQTVADFESQNFFRPKLFEDLEDLNGASPVVQIAQYSKSIKSRSMSVDDLASYMHITADEKYVPLFSALLLLGW